VLNVGREDYLIMRRFKIVLESSPILLNERKGAVFGIANLARRIALFRSLISFEEL
jgi:hypothetical protein